MTQPNGVVMVVAGVKYPLLLALALALEMESAEVSTPVLVAMLVS